MYIVAEYQILYFICCNIISYITNITDLNIIAKYRLLNIRLYFALCYKIWYIRMLYIIHLVQHQF